MHSTARSSAAVVSRPVRHSWCGSDGAVRCVTSPRRCASGAKSPLVTKMIAATPSRHNAASSSSPAVQLNDGNTHPLLGFGTYKVGFIPASSSGETGMRDA